jgi:hypothetical protein
VFAHGAIIAMILAYFTIAARFALSSTIKGGSAHISKGASTSIKCQIKLRDSNFKLRH